MRSRWELAVGDNHRPKITEFVDFQRSHIRSAEIFSSGPSGSAVNKPKDNHLYNTKYRPNPLHKILATTTVQALVK